MEEKRCGVCEAPEVTKYPPCPNQCKHPKCKSYPPKEKPDYFGKVFIWVYGAPSVGKTSVIKLVCAKYKLQRLHVGELLHAELETGSVRAKCIANIMSRGELVPNDLVMELLKQATDLRVKECTGFVIDGFPRDKRQGMLFEKIIAPVNVLIFMDGDKQKITARHIERAANTDKRWPTDKRLDNCVAGKLQLRIFYENHDEIMWQYPHKILRIQTDGKTVEQVYTEMCQIIDSTLTKNFEKVKKEQEERARNTDCFIRKPYKSN